jgi:hypothetical protein
MADVLDELVSALGDTGLDNAVNDDNQEEESPYKDLELVNKHINDGLNADKSQRSIFERSWFRNVLFWVGQQWIIFDGGRWRPRDLPAWFPRTQTNKFAEIANDIIASLMQGRVPITYVPATDDPEDMAMAEIADKVVDVIYEEAEMDEKETELAAWMILTGNAFLIPYYDISDEHGTNNLPSQQCNTCQKISTPSEIAEADDMCPACVEAGQQEDTSSFSPVEDQDESFPIGKICADVVSPFEIRLDYRIRNIRDHRWYSRVRRYDVSYAKELWSNYKDNITADKGAGMATTSQHYLDILAQVTDAFNPAGTSNVSSTENGGKQEKVTVYEFYELPSEDFPEGLRAVRIGTSMETIVEAGELPFEYTQGFRKGQKFLNIVHFGFDTTPGRFWKKTRLDDLIPIQIYRNMVEASMRLSIQRMGNSVWLNPKGSGAQNLTGEPGQIIDYNPVSFGGTALAKPERVEAAIGHLQSLVIILNKLDDQMERVAGTFFLAGGQTPPGVTAASALAYLGERSQKSMAPVVRDWAKSFKKFNLMGLEIARANWDDTRLNIISGKNKEWEVSKFTKEDLQGNVNGVIDYEGLYPKSQATRRATIQQLVQTGVLNVQDPETKYKILEIFGETELLGSVDLDAKEAIRENDAFMLDGTQPELVPMAQNSTVHLMTHNDLIKTQEFKLLPDQQKQMMYAHIKGHITDIVARQAAFGTLGVDGQGMDSVTSEEAGIAASAKQELDAQAQQQQPLTGSQPGQMNPESPEQAPDIANMSPDMVKPPI